MITIAPLATQINDILHIWICGSAQPTKCLLGKCEAVFSSPTTHIKETGTVAHVGLWRHEHPWSSLSSQPSLLGKLLSQKQEGWHPKNNIQGCLLASTHTYTHMHAQSHAYMYINIQYHTPCVNHFPMTQPSDYFWNTMVYNVALVYLGSLICSTCCPTLSFYTGSYVTKAGLKLST